MSTPQLIREQLLQGPAQEPPPGETSNFVNPANKTFWYIVTVVICLTLPTLALLIRLYTKLCINKIRDWEDYLCVVGWFLYVAFCTLGGLMVHNGAGVHQWNVQLERAIKVFYYTYISEIIYGVMILTLKTSILVQYRRIFKPARKMDYMFWGTHSLNAMMIVYYMTMTLMTIFQCHPRQKAWDPLVLGGHCMAISNLISSGYLNVITNFATLLLPHGVIWRLHIPLQKKIAVSSIFLVGLFACISSIMRLYYSYEVKRLGDFTYSIAIMGNWTYAEIASCIICACLHVFPRFFQAIGKVWGPNIGNSSKPRLLGRKRPSISIIAEAEMVPQRAHSLGRSFKNPYCALGEQELVERGQYDDFGQQIPMARIPLAHTR